MFASINSINIIMMVDMSMVVNVSVHDVCALLVLLVLRLCVRVSAFLCVCVFVCVLVVCQPSVLIFDFIKFKI